MGLAGVRVNKERRLLNGHENGSGTRSEQCEMRRNCLAEKDTVPAEKASKQPLRCKLRLNGLSYNPPTPEAGLRMTVQELSVTKPARLQAGKSEEDWMRLKGLLVFLALVLLNTSPAQLLAQPAAQVAGVGFLTRIRVADPDYKVVLIAALKGNELNLLLSRHVTESEIPILVRGLAGQFSRSFPGADVSVVAFRPVVPLQEAARANFDGRTGEVTLVPGPGLSQHD
jgi:hypothetical protein